MKSRPIVLIITGMLLGLGVQTKSQELFVATEPASNMPSKSLGIRLTNEGIFNGNKMNRSIPELMLGVNKALMFHVQGFLSDMDGRYRLEGGSLYAKYRFLSIDDTQKHLRLAAFGRLSTSKRPVYSEDINLEGDNTGAQGGLIVTQLLHKLAISGTLSYARAFGQESQHVPGILQPDQMIGYSLSSGYLLLPVRYKDYQQPNFNVYFEILGKTNPVNGSSYLDFSPAVQVILNSRTRIDLGYRFQVNGNMDKRFNKNMYLLRAEFNLFNVLK